VVQGQLPLIEAQEEQGHSEDEEHDEAVSVSLVAEQNRAANLRDAGGKSPLCQPGHKTVTQSSSRSQRKIQEISLTTLDPFNLSPR